MTNSEELVTDEVVEEACYAWLRSLFPAKASEEEIRGRITDNDRDHVRYVLSAALPAALAIASEDTALGVVGEDRDRLTLEAQRLACDVLGTFHYAEDAVREAIGNTNYTVIFEQAERVSALTGGQQ
jgi:hypothetical protein